MTTTPRFPDTIHEPLRTDELVERRVCELIGHATQRQLWLMFLDDECVQLPLLVPVDGMPLSPDSGNDGRLARFFDMLVDTANATQLIVVVERYTSAELTKNDVAWARAIHDACDDAEIPLRAIFLAHRTGVRRIAQDDYRF